MSEHTSTEHLLSELKGMSIAVHLDGGSLSLQYPKGVMTSSLVERIQEKKEEIIQYLNDLQNRDGMNMPIPVADIAARYPLSSAQQQLWVAYAMNKRSPAYNTNNCFRVRSRLDLSIYEKAVTSVVTRNEILRTVFCEADGVPFQKIRPADEVDVKIDYSDLGSHPDGVAIVGEQIRRDQLEPFDLEELPLFRIKLFRLGEEDYFFYYNMHHIISDGWSLSILARQITACYHAYAHALEPALPPLRVQYKDYAVWQQEQLRSGRFDASKRYWQEKLSGELPVLELPSLRPGPPTMDIDGSRLKATINSHCLNSLKAFCISHKGTLFMGLVAVLKCLLYRYTAREDIVVGTVVSGRCHPDIEDQIGCFVNKLPLRTTFDGTASFSTLFARVSESILGAQRNQQYPFDRLVKDLSIRRLPNRWAVFDIMIVFYGENDPDDAGQEGRGADEAVEEESTSLVKMDLILSFTEKPDGINLYLYYNTNVYEKATMLGLITHYIELLKGVTADPGLPLWKYRYMREGDRTLLLGRYGVRSNAYPAGETITGVFRARAGEAPGAIAVRYKEVSLTYGELDRRSSEVALLLRQRGVGRDMPVGLLMERSADLIVAILGILKAGGAYLPIDTELPKERQHYIIRDGRVRLLLSGRGLGEEVPDGVEVVYLEDAVADNGEVVLEDIHGPDDLCYVIYTSGTTGNPKGVMIMHRNITGLLLNEGFPFDFGRDDVWTMFHSHCFDFSVWEIFGALLRGGKLIIVPREVTRDSYRYLELLEEEGVTVLNQTPGAFYQLIQAAVTRPGGLAALRYVVLGGEALSPVRLKEWKAAYPGVRLYNGYGITETTIFVSFHEVSQADIDNNSNNIGRPLPSASVYLLDGHGEPVAEGITGEIYVGGLGVARGYLHNEGLTEQRFVPDVLGGGGRLYRSGDLARIGDHGEIEYVGRADHQIKIRGYRVDPLEIEHTLQGLPGIGSAVVLAVEDERGERRLAAYITGEASQDSQALRLRLADILPGYMIPAYIIHLHQLPLTVNGKIDRQQLPEPANPAATPRAEYVRPETPVEEALAAIWAEIFSADRIGTTDHFFELGGDSLKMMFLANRIRKAFGAEISVVGFFRDPCIRHLAREIEAFRDVEKIMVRSKDDTGRKEISI